LACFIFFQERYSLKWHFLQSLAPTYVAPAVGSSPSLSGTPSTWLPTARTAQAINRIERLRTIAPPAREVTISLPG